MPAVRQALFAPTERPGYSQLRLPLAEVKETILQHPEFQTFNQAAKQIFNDWQQAHLAELQQIDHSTQPKELIEQLSESLLARFKNSPLLNAYDIYQQLMDYWAASMQDDCYLISADGWQQGAKPREQIKSKNANNKLEWPKEPFDYTQGKRRFKSELIPAQLLIDRYLMEEQDNLTLAEGMLADIEQQLQELLEEHGSEDGLLAEVVEGEGDKQKVTAKAIKAQLNTLGMSADDAQERSLLKQCEKLLNLQSRAKTVVKDTTELLNEAIAERYPKLSQADIQTLVIHDKWMAALSAAEHSELDRVSQTLTSRIRELAERYATPLPQLVDEVEALAAKVDGHLKKMGAVWN